VAVRPGRLLAARNRGDGHRRHNRRRVRAEHAAPWRHTPLERPRAQAAAKQRLARERYALADDERELAVLDGKGWGRRPVKVTVDDLGAVDPALLLFAAFVVRSLAEDAAGAAAAGSTAATSSSG
jgi:hypothetical protein